MNDVRTFDQIGPGDVDQVGGKGLGLATLARAGLPVPSAFCVTTAAYRRLKNCSLRDDSQLVTDIANAYRELGGGPVAVRSSATAEDGIFASFAGQQETILGVTGENAVVDAIGRCWASLESARAQLYRQRQGLTDSGLAMGVVVQRLVPAEVSGVLFTRDPNDPDDRRMLVEASWGLGESIVSGLVSPDRYSLDAGTGAVLERYVSVKHTMTTPQGPAPVPPEKQGVLCLDDRRLEELARLGQQVEALYGEPRDIEWAWAEGRFWLLQARPITAVTAAERERVRREEMAALAALADPKGTVWSRYNLSEILPAPTPMTWAIVRRFMSGQGGFGLMYRDMGCSPDSALDDECAFDLVCGRPYCNLSREPQMQFSGLPISHSFQALKTAPEKALYPTATFNPSDAGPRFWLFLPFILVRLFRFELRVRRLGRSVAQQLRDHVFPAFAAETERESTHDLAREDVPALLDRLEFWTKRTVVDFARDSLKPTIMAAVAMSKLEKEFSRALGADRARAAVSELAMGVRPDPEADLPAALRQLAAGQLERADFLTRHGHRGSDEMELSQPRWAEDPTALGAGLPTPPKPPTDGSPTAPDPATWERICREARLSTAKRIALEPDLHDLHTYLGLRETAKHYFMKGYALIRRILIELDR